MRYQQPFPAAGLSQTLNLDQITYHWGILRPKWFRQTDRGDKNENKLHLKYLLWTCMMRTWENSYAFYMNQYINNSIVWILVGYRNPLWVGSLRPDFACQTSLFSTSFFNFVSSLSNSFQTILDMKNQNQSDHHKLWFITDDPFQKFDHLIKTFKEFGSTLWKICKKMFQYDEFFAWHHFYSKCTRDRLIVLRTSNRDGKWQFFFT